MSSVEEIAAQLERQLADASSKIDEFVLTQSSALQKAASDHEALMRSLEGKIMKLQFEEERATYRSAEVTAALDADRRSLGERSTELLSLKTQSQSLPIELEAAKAAEAEAKAQLARHQEEYRRREDEVKFQLQELTKGLAFYKRLGLEFEHLSDRGLTLIFTQIDALHPARRFTFDVGIAGESDAYVISNVEPPVPGMDGMVAALNADGDFGRFTREMRRRFVELAPLTRK